jgi:hypothetical protein
MTLTPQEHKEVATEIIHQLGGRRFMAMTGAHDFLYDDRQENGNLYFKFPGSQTANFCKITLEPSDTYTVEFLKVRGANVRTIKTCEDVYGDMLQDIFTSTTGLVTSL